MIKRRIRRKSKKAKKVRLPGCSVELNANALAHLLQRCIGMHHLKRDKPRQHLPISYIVVIPQLRGGRLALEKKYKNKNNVESV